MRVITGSARGRKLNTLEGNDVRPTTDRVKEAVFSIIQFEIEGRRVLDLFSGSGQLGIEALSRGAEAAVFVDNSPASIKVIRDNIDKTGFSDRSSVIPADAMMYISSCKERFDIAFLDPPYGNKMIDAVLPYLVRVMKKGGVIICETSYGEELPEEAAPFVKTRTYKYGKTLITLYRHKDVTF